MNREDFFKDYLSLSYGQMDEAWIEDKARQFEYNYAEYFPKHKDASMLDIGPGHGGMLSLWKRLDYKNYIAVDISHEVVQFCKDRDLGEVKLIKSLQDFLKDKENTYDFISMIEVVEHLKKDEILETLNSIRKGLKPKGRVIIETPNVGTISGSLLRHYDFTHEVGFTAHSLRQLMDTIGFNEIAVKGFDGTYKRDPRSRIRRFLRNHLLYLAVRMVRRMNDSDLTEVLLPYIYATAVK